MDELMISGKRYISTRRAGKEHHYHSDYIGQLIRAGKIAGQKVGRAWYVSEISLIEHLAREAAEGKSGARPSKRLHAPLAVEMVKSTVPHPEVLPAKTPVSISPAIEDGVLDNVPRGSSKMLTYFSEAPEPMELKKRNERMGVQEERVHLSKMIASEPVLQENADTWDEQEDTEAEMPIPMRVTNRPSWNPSPQPVFAPAFYTEQEMPLTTSFSYRPRTGRIRVITGIAIIGFLALIGGFGASFLPF